MFHHLPNQKSENKNWLKTTTKIQRCFFWMFPVNWSRKTRVGNCWSNSQVAGNAESHFWGALWYPILGTEKKAEARNHPGRKSLLFVSQDLWACFGGAFGEFQWSSSTTLTGPANFWVLAKLQESSILPTKIPEKYVSNLQNDHHDSWHESSCNGSKNTMSTHPRHLFHSSPPAASPPLPLVVQRKRMLSLKPNTPETRNTHSPASWIKTWDFLIAIPRNRMRRKHA